MGGSFTELSHTADTGIEVSADSLGELLEWAARGMFSLMYPLDELTSTRSVLVEVDSPDTAELLVDLLSDILYLAEAHDVIPCVFQTREATATAARVMVHVAPLEPDWLHGPPIKAVTYHDLAVTNDTEDGWRARIVFDV